jgi:uncharacterized protein YndB with AHSA1/START domain
VTNAHNAQHGSFTLERVFDAPVALVFAAFGDTAAKSKWFGGGSEWDQQVRVQNFRVGGEDELTGKWRASGKVTQFRARYFDIVADTRIVYAYEMFLDGKKISTSLATVQFIPDGKKTKLIVTEQGAFLDGYDDAGSREHGVGAQMDRLGETLKA